MNIDEKISKYLNEASEMSKAEQVRQYAPGYVGGEEIASRATDEQLEKLIELLDKKADLYNRHIAPIMKEVEKMKSTIKRQKKIKR